MEMTVVISVGGTTLLAHAFFAFLQSFWAIQYNHLRRILIKGLESEMDVDRVLMHNVRRGILCKHVVSCVLLWSRPLRILGLIPLTLYFLTFVLVGSSPILQPDAREAFEPVKQAALVAGFLSQVFYLLLKLFSRFPTVLTTHKTYEEVPPLKILLDIVPIWGKR